MKAPSILVEREGRWVELFHEAGYPAGILHTMTLDLTGKVLPGDRKIRIASNMELYWDRIFLAEHFPAEKLALKESAVRSADLHFFGYPREYSPDGRKPNLFDYDNTDRSVGWKLLPGDYTRLRGGRRALEGGRRLLRDHGPRRRSHAPFPGRGVRPCPAWLPPHVPLEDGQLLQRHGSPHGLSRHGRSLAVPRDERFSLRPSGALSPDEEKQGVPRAVQHPQDTDRVSVGVPALAGDGISRAKGKPPEGGTPTFGWHALRNEGRGKATNHALRSSGRATQPAMGQVARRGNRLKAGLQRKAGRMDAIPELDVLCRDHVSETAKELGGIRTGFLGCTCRGVDLRCEQPGPSLCDPWDLPILRQVPAFNRTT